MLWAFFAAAAYGMQQHTEYVLSLGWRRLPSPAKAVLFCRGNTLVAAFSGTKLTDTEDLADDAALYNGTEDQRPRVQQARKWLLAVAQQYPRSQLIVTGHSLGGSIALASVYYVPNIAAAHCYNSYASSTMRTRSGTATNGWASYKRATLHLTLQDPINVSSFLMKQVTFDTRVRLHDWLNPHALANWLDDIAVMSPQYPLTLTVEDLLPVTMTSYTSQGYTVSCNNEQLQYNGQAWHLFDRNSNMWIARMTDPMPTTVVDGVSIVGHWVQLQVPIGREMDSYDISSAHNVRAKNVKQWYVAGSTDGQAWTLLDTRTDVMVALKDFSPVTTYTLNCQAIKGGLSYYRLIVTANYGDYYVEISDFRPYARVLINDSWV